MSIIRNLTIVALLAATGCTSLPTLAMFGEQIPVADAQHPVMDMSCIWQAGEGRTPEGFPCRGFCGQMMFIAAGSRKPAIVNGSVKVYVFDHLQTEPLNMYEFTPQEWATFARKTNLGMTYQLFVPYTRKGSHHADCSIRICFTSADTGRSIWSQPTSIVLNGKGPSPTATQQVAEPTTASLQSDAAFHALARKLQTEQAAGRQPEPQPANDAALEVLRQRAAGPDPRSQIRQLQAVLDETDRRRVQHADYTEVSESSSPVTNADLQEYP